MQICTLAFAHLKNVHVLDVEQHMPTPSFTVQTLRALRAQLPLLQPSFVIGTDILDELHLWKEPDALQELCELVVVPRGGFPRRGKLELELPEVSSSEVRKRLLLGDDAGSLIDKEVHAYVRQRGLYSAQP